MSCSPEAVQRPYLFFAIRARPKDKDAVRFCICGRDVRAFGEW
jgi:hypothetical protein